MSTCDICSSPAIHSYYRLLTGDAGRILSKQYHRCEKCYARNHFNRFNYKTLEEAQHELITRRLSNE